MLCGDALYMYLRIFFADIQPLSAYLRKGFFMSKMSTCSIGLIWFGAGVSVAEILTGVSVSTLGFKKGILAIIIGHIIGCTLLCIAGIIGGKTGKSSMDTVKMSFGNKGVILFASLNVIQLVGWTSVMISNGALGLQNLYPVGQWLWCILIGIMVLLWIAVDTRKLDILNIFSVGLLFILTIVLSVAVFKNDDMAVQTNAISFGSAVELSAAMPISWLPLISDYTSRAKRPVAASVVSSAVYFFVSCWMYIIGMGMAVFTGESDIGVILTKAGLGVAALLVFIFSTVTTTYLDVFSAGASCKSIFKGLNSKTAAIIVAVTGAVLAVFVNVGIYENFLYFIGSVFAPMVAIQIADFYIIKKNCEHKKADIKAIVIWFVGFLIYRVMMRTDMILGYTLPAILIVMLLYIACCKGEKK